MQVSGCQRERESEGERRATAATILSSGSSYLTEELTLPPGTASFLFLFPRQRSPAERLPPHPPAPPLDPSSRSLPAARVSPTPPLLPLLMLDLNIFSVASVSPSPVSTRHNHKPRTRRTLQNSDLLFSGPVEFWYYLHE